MQKVMLSLARRVGEASMRPLPGEERDLSQQYEVRLRAKEITAYQQSLADALQFDEDDERQDDAQVGFWSSTTFASPLRCPNLNKPHIAKEVTASPANSDFSLR